MRKRFNDLSRSGKSKFIKRIEVSTEEKSSCTNDGVENVAEKNISNGNRFSDSAIPSTSRDDDGFELILPLNDNEEGEEEEMIRQTGEEIRRHKDEELVRQNIGNVIIHEDDDKVIIGMDGEENGEEIELSSNDEDEEIEIENEDELEETDEHDEGDGENDRYEDTYDDEETNGSEEEEIMNHEIRINYHNNNQNNNDRSNMQQNLDYDDEYDDEYYERPVYEDSPLTVEKSMMIMMSLVLKYNLPDTCVEDFFEAISMHCPPRNLQKLNLYYYSKYFKHGNSTKKHYFCSTCGSSLEKEKDNCPVCIKEVKARYFCTLSIIDQTRLILDKTENYNFIIQNFNNRVNNDDNALKDISDGLVYREHEEYFSDLGSLSYTWYADGVPVFKSSKLSVWPFYLRINELPYDNRIRRENTILAGLWFGDDKPIPHLFLEAFEPELRTLFHGLNLYLKHIDQQIFIRAMLLCGTCDLPAKYAFLNFQQYNGTYGCSICKIQTEKTKLPNQKSIRVYRHKLVLEYRTLDETKKFAEQARRNKSNPRLPKRLHVVQGVKGPSVLNKLMPNYVTGTGIDSMHALYEGVTKKLIYLWSDSSLSNSPFSLRPVLDVIDAKILKLRAPNFAHRQPRQLSKYESWKASEYKAWCYYYSPVILSSIMKTEYYNHYLLFVSAMSLLNKDVVSFEDIELAAGLIEKFVDHFEILYGVRFCSINFHQLLHLPNDVKKFGPSWGNSCFSFEDLNGKIVASVNGTTNSETQIMNGHWQYLRFHTEAQNLSEGSLRNFILRQKKQFKICESFNDAESIGIYKIYDPVNDPVVLDILNNLNGVNNNVTVRKYLRLLKDGLLYTATSYTRSLKTNSSFVQYKSGEIFHFGKILYFVKISGCNCSGNKCLCDGLHFAIINFIEMKNNLKFTFEGDEFELPYLYECQATDNIGSIPVSNIISVCYCVYDDDNLFLGCRINGHERE